MPNASPDESTCSSKIMAMGFGGRAGGDSRRQLNH